VAVDLALFVSKRLMPVAAALLLLVSARLADRLKPLPGAHSAAASSSEVRVVIAR
jgi:hypothetical protein